MEESAIVTGRRRMIPVWRVAFVVFLQMGVSTLLHVLGGILSGDRGAPSFMTAGFIVYGVLSATLLSVAYILLGNQMPIRRGVVRGVTFILLFLGSDYLPQVLGIMGAPSPGIDPDSLSLPVVLLDSMSYLVTGIFLGLLLPREKNTRISEQPADPVKIRSLVMTCTCSAFLFSVVTFLLETALAGTRPEFGVAAVFGIKDADKLVFLLTFYGLLWVSGAVLPVFYVLTRHAYPVSGQWWRFALTYGLLLWTPVVLIVIFFGVPLISTLVFAVLFLVVILLDSLVISRLLYPERKVAEGV